MILTTEGLLFFGFAAVRQEERTEARKPELAKNIPAPEGGELLASEDSLLFFGPLRFFGLFAARRS